MTTTKTDNSSPGPKAHTHGLTATDAQIAADRQRLTWLESGLQALGNSVLAVSDAGKAQCDALDARVTKLEAPPVQPPPVVPPVIPPIVVGATPNIPTSIDPTGQMDVTGPLQSWLSGLPTGATAVMGNGATYLVNGTVHLSGRSPLTIDWNGSGWVQKVRSATRIALFDGGGSGLRLLTPKITGANPNPGKWDPAWENNHAIQVGGVDGVDIVAAQLTNVSGDGIYLSGGANKWAKKVNVIRPVIDGIGRMGIAFTDGVSGFLIDAATFARIGYYTIDFEPNGATVEGRAAGAENGIIRNCVATVKPYGDYPTDKTQATGYYLVFTGASGGGPATNIECYGCRSDDPVQSSFRWNNFLGGTVNVHDNVRGQVQS